MNPQTAQHTRTIIAAAVRATYPEIPPRPVYLTVEQFSERNPAFTPASLRNLIFKGAERESTRGRISGNGLVQAGAILRIGRKVLLCESRFFAWIEAQQAGSRK